MYISGTLYASVCSLNICLQSAAAEVDDDGHIIIIFFMQVILLLLPVCFCSSSCWSSVVA